MENLELDPPALKYGGRLVLRLAHGWSIRPLQDSMAEGGFELAWNSEEPVPLRTMTLGNPVGVRRHVALCRFSPFWVQTHHGEKASEVPPETVWWMGEMDEQLHLMIVPLIDGLARHSLRGSPDGLAVAMQTGDDAVKVSAAVGVLVLIGADPQRLAARAAHRAASAGRVRADKPDPDFIDLLGWCTWDAFYKAVTADSVILGMQAFKRAGIVPRLLILDDGWHQRKAGPHGEESLVGLAPHSDFGSSLRDLIRQLRERFGIRRVLVWHALLGYWGGIDEQSFPDFEIQTVRRRFGPGLQSQGTDWNEGPWGSAIRCPSVRGLARLYDRWHSELAAQGVDGVKVDAQGLLEGVSHGPNSEGSGQVQQARAVKNVLEASVNRHFGGRVIHCMACNQEGAYLNETTSVLRTSDDFFPDRPESHGRHLLVNALAGLWFGQFMRPDWDMFQSAHPAGAFHAAARAISGGPVVLSDRPGEHDASLLRRLAYSDGTVPRCDGVAQASPRSLYEDPARATTPLKVFNRCGDAAVLGFFHLGLGSIDGRGLRLDDQPQLADIPGLDSIGSSRAPQEPCPEWAAWLDQAQCLWRPGHDEAPPTISLQPLEWELVTLAPVRRGLAVFGLSELLNRVGAVIERTGDEAGELVRLRDGGTLLIWSSWRPQAVMLSGVENETPLPVAWTQRPDGILTIEVPGSGPRDVCLIR